MIELFDVNCRVGPGPAPREGAPNDTAALTSLMDTFGVTKALVYHATAEYSDTQLGNRLVLETAGGRERLLPQWCVMPGLWDLFPAPGELLGAMRAADVSTVRLLPAQYGHSMKRYAAGALMDALAECRVPVFLPLGQVPSWDALWEICTDYPQNRIVLCSPGYRCLRWLAPMMEQCPNLYVETSNLLMHDGLRLLCAHFGAGRLLFGSGMPEASVAAAAAQLRLSGLPEEQMRMIAAENALRLLSEVKL